MIEVFKQSDFKIMPWKNGGGITTELFRLPSSDNNSFLFRLSRAEVSSNGPFSAFPNVDRILLLIDGRGFHLSSNNRKIELNKKLDPLSFHGEEIFSCALIGGPCIDFNIMTDRNFANSTISVIRPNNDAPMNFKAECDLKFIYDIGKETLYKLEKSDLHNISVSKDFPLIVINTKFL